MLKVFNEADGKNERNNIKHAHNGNDNNEKPKSTEETEIVENETKKKIKIKLKFNRQTAHIYKYTPILAHNANAHADIQTNILKNMLSKQGSLKKRLRIAK